MADNCIIGPVSIADPYLVSDVEPLDKEGKEFFKVKCTKPQARQLLGLVSHFTEKTVNGRKVYNLQGGYGVIPIDASTNISDGLIRPRGLYIVEEVLTDLRPASPKSVAGLTVRKLSDDFTGLFDMDYTTGYDDGTSLRSTYPPSVKTNKFTDEFTSFDTTNVWYPVISSNMSSGSVTASGGDLTFAGGSNVAGTTGGMLTTNRTVLHAPFTLEFSLEWDLLNGTGRTHELAFMLLASVPSSINTGECSGIWVRVKCTSTTAYIYIHEYEGGVGKEKYSTTLTSDQKTPTFLVSVDGAGKITIKADKAGGASYSTKLNGYTPSNNFGNNYYFGYRFTNNTTSSRTMKSERVEAYDFTDLQGLNVVALPVSSNYVTNISGSRVSEEGTIPLYNNPTGNLKYSTTHVNFFKGMVKAWNSNYPDDISRLVTSTWDTLKISDFYVTNGLIKLVPVATGVELYYWNGTSYVLVNTFTIGTITNIKPLYVSQERFILQLNSTEWTIQRGKPYVQVKHENDVLGYTRQTSYYHDGVIHNALAADADVTMLTQNHALCFNPYNILTENQYDVETGTAGFTAVGSTLTQVTEGSYGKALKVETANAANYEGVMTDLRPLVGTNLTGLVLVFRAVMHGTGTVTMRIYERDSVGGTISSTISNPITLDGTPKPYDIYVTISSSSTKAVNMRVATTTQSGVTFYLDRNQVAPTPIASKLNSTAPNTANQYGLLITKTDPTTIKSNSIPASNYTGIGVYDQFMRPETIGHYGRIARESMIRTLQQIGVS